MPVEGGSPNVCILVTALPLCDFLSLSLGLSHYEFRVRFGKCAPRGCWDWGAVRTELLVLRFPAASDRKSSPLSSVQCHGFHSQGTEVT